MQVKSQPAGKPPLWLLVLVTLSGTMAMHMFIPALPEAGRSLAVSTGAMQMAITTYIVGLGVGQLVYGPLSDAMGRRPMLLAGLACYVCGGLACALAPGLDTLLAGRLIQALGGCAGLALGRAIVRDTTSGDAAVRELALLNVMILIGPGVGPVVGGMLALEAGWRAIFIVLAGIGAVTLLFAWRLLPETSSPSGRSGARTLLRDYRSLLGSPRFLGLAFVGACSTTSVYAFLSAVPFTFTNDLHQPVQKVGLFAGLMILGMGVGSSLTSWLSSRIGTMRLLHIGGWLSLASVAALLAVSMAGALSVANTIGLMLVFTCGCGMVSPVTLAHAMSVDPKRVGSAAGLYGFIQMAVGAACTTLATFGSNATRSALIVMVGAAILARVALWPAHQK